MTGVPRATLALALGLTRETELPALMPGVQGFVLLSSLIRDYLGDRSAAWRGTQVLPLVSSRSTASRALTMGMLAQRPIGKRSRLSPDAMRSAWPVMAAAMT